MYVHRDKIVITGGAGFIGSHLVERLLDDGHAHVVVFDNLSRGRLTNLAPYQTDPRLHFVKGDVQDADAVAGVVQGATVVYHLASQCDAWSPADDMETTFGTNVVGTFNVLRAAAHHHVDRVIFASSSEVYGEPITLPVDEGHPLMAISAYGVSKASGEAYCRAFRRLFDLQTVILRFANVYGPRDCGRVIPFWLERAMAGQDLPVHGGKQIADFLWVGQAVEALIRAAQVEHCAQAINVGSGTGTKIVDVARRIARLTRSRGKIELLPARPVEVSQFVANVDRMRQTLKIEPALDPLSRLPALVDAPFAAAGALHA